MTPIEKARTRSRAHDLLGLTGRTTDDAIRAAWKRRAFELHPDRQNGDDRAFRCAQSAFQYLMGETETLDLPSDPQKDARPMRRAAIKTRIVELSSRDEVTRAASGPVPSEEGVSDHIATKVRRKGRRLNYIISGELREGTNRITIPADRSRGAKPRSLSFTSPRNGTGRIVVPDTVRETKFPEARQVSIAFEAD